MKPFVSWMDAYYVMMLCALCRTMIFSFLQRHNFLPRLCACDTRLTSAIFASCESAALQRLRAAFVRE